MASNNFVRIDIGHRLCHRTIKVLDDIKKIDKTFLIFDDYRPLLDPKKIRKIDLLYSIRNKNAGSSK